jgi:hypothetical protein
MNGNECQYTAISHRRTETLYRRAHRWGCVATQARTMDEIVARLISREALMHPRLRGMWAIQGLGALVLSLILLADFYAWPLPFSVDFLSALGPPLRVLLVLALLAEGVAVAQRFARHREPPYSEFVQSGALALAAAGIVVAGIGLLVYFSWTGLFAHYYAGASWVEPLYYGMMLVGPGALLAALPPLAGSLIRPFVAERVVEN